MIIIKKNTGNETIEFLRQSEFSEAKISICTLTLINIDSLLDRLKDWARVLRTTTRKQVKEVLVSNDGFCCLGILGIKFVDNFSKEYLKDGRADFLSECDAQEAFNTNDDTGELVEFQEIFSNLNDNYNLTFKQISKVILEMVTGIELLRNSDEIEVSINETLSN